MYIGCIYKKCFKIHHRPDGYFVAGTLPDTLNPPDRPGLRRYWHLLWISERTGHRGEMGRRIKFHGTIQTKWGQLCEPNSYDVGIVSPNTV